MEKRPFLTKEESSLIQGVAVLLIVFHHLFAFPERVDVPYVLVFDFDVLHIETMLSYFGRICVSIFAFLSGYGLYKKLSGQKYQFSVLENYKNILKQLLRFLLRYWLVLAVFAAAGYLLQVYAFDWQILLNHILGRSCAYNAEWWYVAFYLELLLVFPLLYGAMRIPAKWIGEKWSAVLTWGAVIILSAVWEHIDMCYLSAVTGMMCAGTGMFQWAVEKLNKVPGMLLGTAVVLMAGIILLRTRLGAAYDFLWAAALVFSFGILLKTKLFRQTVNPVLHLVGKYATYIWLTHTFFAYYYFQEWIYAPYYSWLIFVWCVVLALIPGLILEPIAAHLEKVLLKRSNRKTGE